MNFYTLASKELIELSKLRETYKDVKSGDELDEWCEQILDSRFKATVRRGIMRMEQFNVIAKEMKGDKLSKTFFITIRPDETRCTFPEFKALVDKCLNRKCFTSLKFYSFEQKGTEGDGTGFHVHIVSEMSQRSKGQVAVEIFNSFKDIMTANNIDVRLLSTTKDVEKINDYLTKYVSDDNHKGVTEKGDAVWREANGLLPIYSETPMVTSPVPSAVKNSNVVTMNEKKVLISMT